MPISKLKFKQDYSVRYKEMLEWIGRPAKNVPQQPTPPLRVSISKKLRAYVEGKYDSAGVEKGKYVVVHGIASDSVASMKSRGDDDCLLPLEHWAQIAKEIRFASRRRLLAGMCEPVICSECSHIFLAALTTRG